MDLDTSQAKQMNPLRKFNKNSNYFLFFTGWQENAWKPLSTDASRIRETGLTLGPVEG